MLTHQAAIALANDIQVWVAAVDVGISSEPGCDYSDFAPSCIDRDTLLKVAGSEDRSAEHSAPVLHISCGSTHDRCFAVVTHAICCWFCGI